MNTAEHIMTASELIEILKTFPADEPVWVYEPNDENEPYQAIGTVERGPAGDITIYRK